MERRLDISMEATVLKEPWQSLFTTDELAIAKRRLRKLGYPVRSKRRMDERVKKLRTPAQMPITFSGSDDKYQAWLRRHGHGFVLNARRIPGRSYLVLHRATCSSISAYSDMAKPGGFTERSYIKICAEDIATIGRWIQSAFGEHVAFSAVCGRCKPHG